MTSRLWRVLLALILLLFAASPGHAQIPFYTDDADTTDKGKVHIEAFNEHAWLQRSSRPGLRQNTANFTFNYGITKRIEFDLNFPIITIFNTRDATFVRPTGIGDTQFGIKARLHDEQHGSRLPAVGLAFYVEAPTGSVIKQTGSGLTDYWLYGVLQKTLTKRTTLRLNGGVLFAGNNSTGLIGIETTRGQVYTVVDRLVIYDQ